MRRRRRSTAPRAAAERRRSSSALSTSSARSALTDADGEEPVSPSSPLSPVSARRSRETRRQVLTLNGGNVGEWLDYVNSDPAAAGPELERLELARDRDPAPLAELAASLVPVVSYRAPWLFFWQAFAVVCVLYVSVAVPVAVAWGDTLLPGGACVRWMHRAELAIDLFFVADVGLAFVTSYRDPDTGEEVVDRRCIAWRYAFDPWCGKWLAFDAVASLPTSWILGCVDESGVEYIKFVRFLKLFKMLRMLKVDGIVDTRHLPLFHPVMMRFARILLGLLFVWHLFACVYWSVARGQAMCPRGDACWTPDGDVYGAPFFRQYSYSYIWGIAHSLGSIGAPPVTVIQIWTTAFVAFVGLVTNAIVIGMATNARSPAPRAIAPPGRRPSFARNHRSSTASRASPRRTSGARTWSTTTCATTGPSSRPTTSGA